MKTFLCGLLLLLTTLATPTSGQDDDCETFKADLVFGLDVSGSVGETNFDLMINWVTNVIRGLRVDDDYVRVGLFTFSTDPEVEFRLEEHTNLDGVLNHMSSISYRKGKTHTGKALLLLKDEMFSGPANRKDVHDVVVLVTDGKSSEPNDTLAALESIRGENYTIFAVGVGDVDPDEIDAISSNPDSFFSRVVEDFEFLENLTAAFTESVCEALNPAPPPPRAASNCGGFVADIIFGLDSSLSVDIIEFGQMLDFVVRIIQSIDVGEDDNRIGLFTYSSKVSVEFLLSDFPSLNKEDMIERVKGVPYNGGTTRTDLALDLLSSTMFNNSGNRPDVQDVFILLSDGKSTDEEATLAALNRTKGENYTIFTLGIGNSVNEDELHAISSDPDSTYSVQVEDFDDLATIVDAFASQVCEESNKPSCGMPQADIVIVLDSSGSIKKHNFEKVKEFLVQIVQTFRVSPEEIRVGLMTFASGTEVEFHLDKYESKAEILSAIRKVEYTKGKTYTNKALKELRAMYEGHGNRPEVRDIVIFLSDGKSTKPDETAEEVEELKKTNLTVFSIGIGENVDKGELNSISSDPDDFFTSLVTDFDALEDIESVFSEKACNATSPDFIPPEVIPPPMCSKEAEVVIVMDASSSIGSSDYVKIKTFVKNLIGSFKIGPDDVRVSLIVFNSDAYVEFSLDTKLTKEEIDEAVGNAHGVSRGTYTHLALQAAREKVFPDSRDGKAKILILLTDGRSTQPQMTDSEASKLRDMGVQILALGIGKNIDEAELKSIASDPDETFVQRVADFDALSAVLEQLVDVTCEVMVTTTLDPPVSKRCVPFGDLIIMVDISTSVGGEKITKITDVIMDIIKELDIDEDKVRVALMTFDLIPKVLLTLDDGDGKDDVMEALKGIGEPRYGSWADRAFHAVRTGLLKQSAGERPNAQDVILYFSDGLTRNAEMAILEAEKLKDNGAKIITVGTEGYNKHALRAMSSAPSDDFSFSVKDFEVDRLKELLEDKSCESSIKCGVQADIVIIIDASTSIPKEEFHEMKEFLKHLIYGFEIGPDHVRVGVATYNYDAVMEFHLNSFSTKKQVLHAVDAIYGQGSETRTDKALKLVREVMFSEENGNRDDVPDIVIALTDGRSRDRERTVEEAIKMHKDGIQVFAVGIGSRVSEMELQSIASYPSDRFVYEVKDFKGLSAIESSLKKKTCGLPPVVRPDGYKIQADIVFVFDCSDQVLELNFEWALEFASLIVKSVRGGKKWARFGAIKYSNDAVLEMTLDSYSSRPDILTALDQIERSGWDSRVEKALRMLRTMAFKDCLGGRSSVPDIAIVFSSGTFTHVDAARFEASLAINAGMKIFAVGIGKQVDKFQLEILTSNPYSESVFVAGTREELHSVQGKLLHQLDSALNVCY